MAGRRRLRAAVCLLLLFSLALPAVPVRAEYAPSNSSQLEPEDLTCRSAILVEAETGEVIFEKNADALIYPASTTKIMTTYLGLMLNDPDRMVTVSASAMDIPRSRSASENRSVSKMSCTPPCSAPATRAPT